MRKKLKYYHIYIMVNKVTFEVINTSLGGIHKKYRERALKYQEILKVEFIKGFEESYDENYVVGCFLSD